MLILSRRVGEAIMIGHEITLVVLGVQGNQVRIGIEAPKSIPVHREEIYLAIRAEQQALQTGKQPEPRSVEHRSQSSS